MKWVVRGFRGGRREPALVCRLCVGRRSRAGDALGGAIGKYEGVHGVGGLSVVIGCGWLVQHGGGSPPA